MNAVQAEFGLDRGSLFATDLAMGAIAEIDSLFLLEIAVALLIVACIVGGRASEPTPGEKSVYESARRRRGVLGLYILTGIHAMIAQVANRLVPMSALYRASPFDFTRLGFLIGAAFTLMPMAMAFGWILYDFTAIDDWAFFPRGSPIDHRMGLGRFYIILSALLLYAIADWTFLVRLAANNYGALGVYVVVGLISFATVATQIVANNGLQSLLVVGILIRWSDDIAAVGWIMIVAFLVYLLREKLNVEMTIICALCISAGLIAWLCLRITVETLASVWKRDSEALARWAAFLIAWAVSSVGVILAGPLAVLILGGLEPILPTLWTDGWREIIDRHIANADATATMLTILGALSLVPVTACFVYGLGAALGNRIPPIGRFKRNLREFEAYDLGNDAIEALLSDRRKAYFAGYTLATMIGLGLAGGALYGAREALIRLLQFG